MGKVKVQCIHASANIFEVQLEKILNEENQAYCNIIPIHTSTAGEFKAIIVTEQEDDEGLSEILGEESDDSVPELEEKPEENASDENTLDENTQEIDDKN